MSVCSVREGDPEKAVMDQMSVHSVTTDADEAPSWTPAKRREAFKSRMRFVRRIAVFTSLSYKLIWFLGVSALTWGSGVLLGAYVMNLSTGDFYAVSVLLLIEGIRFGMAGFVRKMRYKMALWVRLLMFAGAQGFLAIAILITAIYSLLPDSSQVWVRLHIFRMHHYSPAPPDGRLRRALRIFYCLMLVNAGQVLIGGIVTAILRWWNVSAWKSLHDYHDKLVGSSLMDSEVSDWMQGRYFSLQFAFKVLSDQYRSGDGGGAEAPIFATSATERIFCCTGAAPYNTPGERQAAAPGSPEEICRDYGDLICYMYMDKEGFHAAEVALEADDVYVREAAANVVWFWAVLEDLVAQSSELQARVKDQRPPLCIQRGLMSKLANLVINNYGPVGFAASSAFKVLLQSPRNPLQLVMSVELVKMFIECIKGLDEARQHFDWVEEEESHVHVELLSCLLHRLQNIESNTSPGMNHDLINKYTSVIPFPTSGDQDKNLQVLIEHVSHINFPLEKASSTNTRAPEPNLGKVFKEDFLKDIPKRTPCLT